MKSLFQKYVRDTHFSATTDIYPTFSGTGDNCEFGNETTVSPVTTGPPETTELPSTTEPPEECIPTDNCDGHFNCTENGFKVCLPGYVGSNCTVRDIPGKEQGDKVPLLCFYWVFHANVSLVMPR